MSTPSGPISIGYLSSKTTDRNGAGTAVHFIASFSLRWSSNIRGYREQLPAICFATCWRLPSDSPIISNCAYPGAHTVVLVVRVVPHRIMYSSFAATILRITYGVTLTQGDTTYHQLVQKLAHIAEDISTPGRHAVEAFPYMLYLPSWAPGGGFKRLAAKWKKDLVAIRDQLYNSAKEMMASIPSSFHCIP